MRVGITGQSGFIGTHLFNTLNLNKKEFETIPFEDAYFEDQNVLENWVTKCDVIVHLAAMSRHEDPKIIYLTNINLVNKLISSFDRTNAKPQILYMSSIQEDLDTEYGRSKKEGRILLHEWAKKNSTKFNGIILPNVYGPYARPNYSSVIATFSHQLTHNEKPQIIIDAKLKLIYINDLVKIMLKCISNKECKPDFKIPATDQKKVSEILNILEYYQEFYCIQGKIPSLKTSFDLNLFDTFKSYID